MTMLTPAARALRSTPGFTAIAVLTMAVAVATNTAIFSIYDQLVLHPVSMPDPGSLVALWLTDPPRNLQAQAISLPRYDELKGRVGSFSSTAVSSFDSFTLTQEGDATQLNGLRISASFLQTLGVMPARGRNFTEVEDQPNGPAVCIVSHELWQTLLGGRDAVVGQTIQLNGSAWEIIGVMPPRLTAPFGQVQVFAPRVPETAGLTQAQKDVGATFAQGIARMRQGATYEQAASELTSLARTYQARRPGNLDVNAILQPRPFVSVLSQGVTPTMNTLLGAVACVLLIACANVAALFLTRLLKRRKEIAVRLSLGAARSAIVRQFLAESLLFSGAAGLLGALIAVWALEALQPVLASQLPPNATLSLNWRALEFDGGVSVACMLLTGLLPAIQASRPDLVEQLKDASRGTSTAQGARLRKVLIVGEVMLSVVLLVGAGLLIASFVKLQRATPGFEPAGVASAFTGLPTSRYATPAHQSDFFEQVIDQLRAQPGVMEAAVSVATPLNGGVRTPYGILGQAPRPIPERPLAAFNVVSEAYFRLFEIPMARGRAFVADDRLNAPLVCVVNESFAKHVFPGQDAVGKVLTFGLNDRHVEIVGVIRDVKSAGVSAPTPDEVYFPLRQLAKPGMNVIAKTTRPAESLQTAIRNAVAAVDRAQAVSFFTTMDSTVATSVGTQRLVATLTAIFAAVALLLSLTGLYSVLAYLVSQRTPEIGIRMALGASRHQVIAMVMRAGLGLVAVGLMLGLGGAAAASRLIRQLLFGVEPVSASIYAFVGISFALVATLACLAPSLRASRIDPLVALRQD